MPLDLLTDGKPNQNFVAFFIYWYRRPPMLYSQSIRNNTDHFANLYFISTGKVDVGKILFIILPLSMVLKIIFIKLFQDVETLFLQRKKDLWNLYNSGPKATLISDNFTYFFF